MFATLAFLVLSTASAQIPAVSQFPVTTQTSFPSPQCTGHSATESLTVNYNFESVERGDPLSPTTQISVYNLLNFLNINYVNTDPDLDGNHLGLTPHTYPSAAAFSALTTNLLNPNTPMITANYSQSTITSFQPSSFWYGCVARSPYSAGSLPVSCEITASGYDRSGKVVASQVFGFVANGSVIQDQNYGVFKGFGDKVYSLGFGVSNTLTTAAVVDNLIAKVFQQACAPFYTGSYNDGT